MKEICISVIYHICLHHFCCVNKSLQEKKKKPRIRGKPVSVARSDEFIDGGKLLEVCLFIKKGLIVVYCLIVGILNNINPIDLS